MEAAGQALRPQDELVWSSPLMKAVFELVNKVAASLVTVLITGETGTGKELIAHALHFLSTRKDKPLITVNCAALPEHLLVKELFGSEKGAFTGADRRRIGKFEIAHGGTIFLDEIGEVPLDSQKTLLRVLEQREFDRVGGTSPVKVDVRVVAATNRDLHREVREKRFREDLYYRLNEVEIRLPPLRDRPEDIPLLATYFAKKHSRTGTSQQIAPEVMEVLRRYHWPGNIRQLEHAIKTAGVLACDQRITLEDLPDEIRDASGANILGFQSYWQRFDRVPFTVAIAVCASEIIARAFRLAGGKTSVAAKRLGLSGNLSRTVKNLESKLGLPEGTLKSGGVGRAHQVDLGSHHFDDGGPFS
jgi:two-component system response regulator AtoC